MDPAAAAARLRRVGTVLRATGQGGLRRELLRGIREVAKPVVPEVRAAAASQLPQRGGLAGQVAGSAFAVRTRLAGRGAGVRIVGTGRQVRALRAIDSGRLRHPVYGHRDTWVAQSVTPGFFTDTIAADAPRIRLGVERITFQIAHKIERTV